MSESHSHEPIHDRLNQQAQAIVRLEEQRTSDTDWRETRKEIVDSGISKLERRVVRLEIALISFGTAGLYGGAKLLLHQLGISI